jgi:hypothetical protein
LLLKQRQLYVFNFFTWRALIKNKDIWFQLYWNRISGVILKYTPAWIITYYDKQQAYKKAHPWKYRGIRFSIFTSMKLAGGGLLVTLIVWPPFVYKIGKGAYYVSQMSLSDIWSVIENIGWKKFALLGTLAGTGLMVWYSIDNILYKPTGKETWVENPNLKKYDKWVKDIQYEKRFKFLDNFSKIFTKFQIFLENKFIDRELVAGINRLEEKANFMEFKKNKFLEACDDWIDMSNKGESESALKNAELKVNARYNKLKEARNWYLGEAEVILKKKFMDEAEPNMEFSKLVKIRILNLSREMNLKEELAEKLEIAAKEGWSKLAIVELKKTYIEELCSVYNSNANIVKTKLEINEWNSNRPKLNEIAQKRIKDLQNKDPFFIELNEILDNAEKAYDLIVKKEGIYNNELEADIKIHNIEMAIAKIRGAPDDWISSETKEFQIKRRKKVAIYTAKIKEMEEMYNKKYGTKKDITDKLCAKFIAKENAQEKSDIEKVMTVRKSKLFTHYNGLPDEKSEGLYKKRDAVNTELNELFKNESWRSRLRDHKLPRKGL